ncbi:MAG: ABC transporter ATP-binding protein [Actinobacteria bacterium]|nr:ABC transporter ATP-binding protein [Actinomycetota bacterium]
MTLLAVDSLRVRYGRGPGSLVAVDGVSFAIEEGVSLGVVGESGSGKSTLARAIVQLVPSLSGRVELDGREITNAAGADLRYVRENVQMVFQDQFSTLNPRRTIGASLAEAIATHRRRSGGTEGPTVAELLDRVTLGGALADRYPHELSGGQLQRVGIARALAAKPRMLILDEVTSALDVSVQAAVLNLLRQLRDELGLTYLCISHDLGVVSYLCEQVMVVYLGQAVEKGPWRSLLAAPRHPYTRALLASVPRVHGEPIRVGTAGGALADPRHPPAGCRFHPRCPVGPTCVAGRERCSTDDPQTLLASGDEWAAACFFPGGEEGK